MDKTIFAGADESSPSRAQYFSWINNTNEGATSSQTRINLEFFQWLHDEYGMKLDIYAFDAGAVDGSGWYGSTESERYQRAFPDGFGPLAKQAERCGARLGLWGGPDGFGDTDEAAKKRHDMMVSFCRDYNFALFKFDSVCGKLRPEKRGNFAAMMTACREAAPDLILLNHRLDLGEAVGHATTFLWGGEETYIDVHMHNKRPAPYSRACVLERGLVPELKRLTEDCGVCLSSCLEGWADDLVLQAFNRCLILAPEIYGNPWLLPDEDYPRLARIYNLHRAFRDILVTGIELPEDSFGKGAVSRGDGANRFITLRNLEWTPRKVKILLVPAIGYTADEPAEIRVLHPYEEILGTFQPGDAVEVVVPPFQAVLVAIGPRVAALAGLRGCRYRVVRDVPGRDVEIDLLGMPGEAYEIHSAGQGLAAPADNEIAFPGKALVEPPHRLLGTLEPCPNPEDAERLYEAECFAADNNALELRELERSGPTRIPQVQAARDAFFDQPLFKRRGISDKNLFNPDPNLSFQITRRWNRMQRIRGGCLRVDFGQAELVDRINIHVADDHDLQPHKAEEAAWATVSADLQHWRKIQFIAGTYMSATVDDGVPVRYLRLSPGPERVLEVTASYRGKSLPRNKWRASNLIGIWRPKFPAKTWHLKFSLDACLPGSRLALAVHGTYGPEGATAALRVGDEVLGAPIRTPSYVANTWECPNSEVTGNSCHIFPLDESMIGKPMEVILMVLLDEEADIRPEVWITHPDPWVKQRIVISRIN